MMGPPGSGKGTQARIISKLFDLIVITTGDMLRDAASKETDFGVIAKAYMGRGDLVPDEIVNWLVRERFRQSDTLKGFILDGYPRSKPQADDLDEILEGLNTNLDHVVLVKLDNEVIINRLSKRRSCPDCGNIYHLESNPPKTPGKCDKCGTELIQRDDDRPEVITKRLFVYHEKTQPLIKRYQKMGIVRTIPGDADLKELPKILKKLLS